MKDPILKSMIVLVVMAVGCQLGLYAFGYPTKPDVLFNSITYGFGALILHWLVQDNPFF